MRVDNGDIPPGKQVFLLRELQGLLEKQIELANQGNIRDIEATAGRASSLVKTITERGIFGKPEFQNQRRQLQKLFKDLRLALTAQKTETAEKINCLRKGKKAVKAYHSNV